MRITRAAFYKRDADRMAGWMRRAGMTRVVIYGCRGNWVTKASGTTRQLAKFAAKEAEYETILP